MKEFYLRVDASRAPEALVALKGAMTASEDSDLLLRRIAELIEKGIFFFIVDMSNLDYVNSNGISTLIAVRKSIEDAGVNVRFVSPPQPLLRIFGNLGLCEYFGLAPEIPLEK
ncbi:MAG: hypothetical protein CVV64_00395 [Candidatus Wallbacteria bacterium HGW-Wallbacteria-1]|uniref:STAS domain-containing protein n=1 Tax=Candidatus Wallbacteria bacterium HGW-Wallbacteria-1 TaxID=2013854 RepID=A0A2N1PUB9_9BACT|nr:MAG: hypothetical protein CVV64_00395 [Candidatus Wallbacteria bacterium HGW-Wallbacteria-1]